jgi:signal peptidase II
MVKTKYYFLLTLLLITLDQSSKLLIYNNLELNQSIVVINNFFSITHLNNYGAAFSFLSNQGGWQRYFLTFISLIASIVIIIWINKVRDKKTIAFSLSVLLAGTIGNLIDRFYLGFVIDFIHLYYDEFYFPVFNFADIFISIGVLLLIIFDLRK